MFNGFLDYFGVEKTVERVDDSYAAFIEKLGGMQFDNGLFNSFSVTETEKWNKIAEEAYPGLTGKLKVFGHDWLGRVFAIDLRGERSGLVLMLEIGTGLALEIPCTFEAFLDEEIILNTDACLAKSFFDEWCSLGKPAPKFGQCVGYKIPLFLGGADDVTNLEISDMEVYWGLLSQMKV